MLIDKFVRPDQQPQSRVVDPFVLIIPFGHAWSFTTQSQPLEHLDSKPIPLHEDQRVNLLLAVKCTIFQYNGEKKSMFPAFLFPKNKTLKAQYINASL